MPFVHNDGMLSKKRLKKYIPFINPACSSFLVFLVILALTQQVAGQAPSIAYNKAADTLVVGAAFSISPVNSGGAVPATTYGNVKLFAGNRLETAGYVDGSDSSALFNWPQQMV
jgi:hypothetical protein